VDTYRIVLADDHILFREGIKRIAEGIPGVEVIGEAGDGLELLELLKKSVPDLIVLDITMPNLSGVEATKKIKELYPKVKILILTMHKSKEHMYHALSAGADGFLLKANAYSDLIKAFEAIRAGETYVSHLMYGFMVDFFRKQQQQLAQPRVLLSAREQGVLQLIAAGKTSKEIGEQLSISISTVQSHRVKIKNKLKIKKMAELIKYAIENGIVS
jgi:DNA-binding NarL/FixJ family response regulator